MSTNITIKEGELEKSKNTLEGLNREHQQLAMNLEKIEALEDKIKTEMTTLKEKMTRMDEEMGTFSDLETLRREAEDKRRQLEEEREELEGRREGVTQNLHEVQLEYDSLKVTNNCMNNKCDFPCIRAQSFHNIQYSEQFSQYSMHYSYLEKVTLTIIIAFFT